MKITTQEILLNTNRLDPTMTMKKNPSQHQTMEKASSLAPPMPPL